MKNKTMQNSDRKKKARPILLIALAFLACAAIVLVPMGIVYGWFQSSSESKGEQEIQPGVLKTMVWFVQDDNTRKAVDDTVFSESGEYDYSEIKVDVVNESAYNHMARLRVAVRYSGTADVALRVRILHFWQEGVDDPSYPARSDLILSRGQNILDNRLADSAYYYCNTDAYAAAGSDSAALLQAYAAPRATIPVITGLNQNVPYSEDMLLNLTVRSEAVQLNRAHAIWGYQNDSFELPTP